jgi:hypothetical protein
MEDEIGKESSMNVREEECMQNIIGKARRPEDMKPLGRSRHG